VVFGSAREISLVVDSQMSRISNAYAYKFRKLLESSRSRRLEKGVACLFKSANDLSARQSIPLSLALARVYEQVSLKIQHWQDQRGSLRLEPARPEAASIRFLCDVGLGGLARWLRAAGYEALWNPHLEDDNHLLREARRTATTLLTTDSLLMERRVLRSGTIPALWVPPTLTMMEQLAVVLQELRLPLREPRCMNCGGELQKTDKESARIRIPPKTYRWLDEYFVCGSCGKLFWRGTHWNKIRQRLESVSRNFK
jgi:uncharacterized protein with PIN domain